LLLRGRLGIKPCVIARGRGEASRLAPHRRQG
jgi:hypothetical protein